MKGTSTSNPHDLKSPPSPVDELDVLLRDAVLGWHLAYVDALSIGAKLVQQRQGYEAVVEHHIRLLKAFLPAKGQQLGLTWTSPNQIDLAHRLSMPHQTLP